MKKHMKCQLRTFLFSLGLTCLIGSVPSFCRAQVDTNTPPGLTNSVPGALEGVFTFLGSGSNWMVAPYGLYDTGAKKPGGGVGLFYAITPNVVTGMRLDYVDGSLFMPSGNLQLQVPINFSPTVALVPFTFAGIAAPIGSGGISSDAPIGIFGIGGALRITKKVDLVGDYEKWTGFPGSQIRFGFLYKF